MSPWQEWSACDGECEEGKVTGYRWRERYHLVDGVPVEKYDPHVSVNMVYIHYGTYLSNTFYLY